MRQLLNPGLVYRGIFRALPDISNGAFLRKWLWAHSLQLFFANCSVLDVWWGPEFTSGYTGMSIEEPWLFILVAWLVYACTHRQGHYFRFFGFICSSPLVTQSAEFCHQTRSKKLHITSVCTPFGQYVFAYPVFSTKVPVPSPTWYFIQIHCILQETCQVGTRVPFLMVWLELAAQKSVPLKRYAC